MTDAWFTEVFRQIGILHCESVAAVHIEPLGTGQVADTFRVTLTYDAIVNGPPTAVVAKLAAVDPDSRAVALAQRLYEREVRFYQHLAGKATIAVPEHYYSDIDTDTGQFVLLLEDLSPASVVDQLTGFDAGQAEAALRQAAALHASLWNQPVLAELDWLNQNRATAAMLAPVSTELTHRFCDRYAADLDTDTSNLLRRLAAHAPHFWTNQHGPLTAVHGDFRPDNMLLGARAGEAPLVVVDWQTVGVGNGLTDVAFLLGTALDPDLRARCEEELVASYFESLKFDGVQEYTWSQCWEYYRYFASYAVFFLAPAAVLVERTDRGDDMFLTMIRRAAAQISALGTESLLGRPGASRC